jgi:Protein of unknown function (DUF2946)
MRLHIHHCRLIWAVLMAVCFATVAPTVSAVLAAQGRVWVEVCTSVGSRMQLVSDDTNTDAPAHAQGAHCPYCLLNQDLATPPAQDWSVRVLPDLQEIRRWQVLALPYQAVAWSHLPSRAPPL